MQQHHYSLTQCASLTQVFGSSRLRGLGLVFLAGACFSLFSPAINLATNDQWRALREGVPHLVIYTAFFYFSVSCFVLGACLNFWLLYHPMAGVPASTARAYARDWNGRHWALLAGLLCGFGNGFQFMGGQAAGYAAADAVQVYFFFLSLFHITVSVIPANCNIIQLQSGVPCSGAAACKHILGSHPFRGIPEIIKKHIPAALFHAVHVHHRCSSSYGFSRA